MILMDRRQALRTLGAFTGLGLLTPGERALAAEARRLLEGGSGAAATRVPALSPRHLETVGVIADIILPPSDTPGASDVGVPAFIDLMVEEWLDEEESAAFISGLDDLDRVARGRFGTPFLEASAEDQLALVQELDEDLASPQAPEGAPDFYRWMKRLTLTGYFTSEEGAALTGYRIVPGGFEGCSAVGGTG